MTSSKQRNLVVVAVVAGLVVATSAYAAIGSTGTSDAEVPTTRVVPARESVSAEQYWEATTRALSCATDAGATVIGPLPAGDGSSITYALRVTDDTDRIEGACLAPLEPLAFRFAIDNGSPPAVQATEGRPTPAGPATKDADALVAIRSRIASCLLAAGIVTDASEAELTRSMHDEADGFATCVAAV